MVDAEFDYTYEYQGNAPKLVHTPLTDKCYLTLTLGMAVSTHAWRHSCMEFGTIPYNILPPLSLPPSSPSPSPTVAAMHMGLGGNPYGPAGTGKTESVKALAGLFGRQVLVFNCDEVSIKYQQQTECVSRKDVYNKYCDTYMLQYSTYIHNIEHSLIFLCCLQGIDVKSMGRIFIGIVKCGAWGCFDEFNRLEETVLSAVSMQIQTIQAALRGRTHSCLLLGKEVN